MVPVLHAYRLTNADDQAAFWNENRGGIIAQIKGFQRL
jgi:hypothetical protein